MQHTPDGRPRRELRLGGQRVRLKIDGVELYYDRPREAWFDPEGRPVLRNERIEIRDLIGESPH